MPRPRDRERLAGSPGTSPLSYPSWHGPASTTKDPVCPIPSTRLLGSAQRNSGGKEAGADPRRRSHLARGSPRAVPCNPCPGEFGAHAAASCASSAALTTWHTEEHTCGHSCNLPASGVSHSLRVPREDCPCHPHHPPHLQSAVVVHGPGTSHSVSSPPVTSLAPPPTTTS